MSHQNPVLILKAPIDAHLGFLDGPAPLGGSWVVLSGVISTATRSITGSNLM